MSPDAIVSSKARKDIIDKTVKTQSYFICHKASIEGKDVCCKTFYDTLGYKSQLVRIAQRLNCVEFVEQTDSDKLPTFKEMQK